MGFLTIICSIICMILIGVLLNYLNVLDSNDAEKLNKIVINIGLPCLIFNALYTADLSALPSFTILTVSTLMSSLIIGLITYFILKLFSLDKKVIWSIVVVVVLGNTGFLGYPMCQGIFGNTGLVRAVFSDLATSIIFILFSAILVLVFDGSIKSAIKKIVTFIPLWSIILGIIFNLLSIPIIDVGTTVIEYLSGLTIPVIMISLGISLNLKGFKENFKEVVSVSAIKLIIYPIIAFLILSVLSVSGLNLNVGVMEACMPSAMLALVLAINFNLDVDLTADCIFTNTLISLITMPIMFAFLIG